MDILTSLPLIFVSDVLFSHGFYVDPHPLLYYVNSVLPLDLVQLIPTIALFYYLTMDETLLPTLFQAIFVFIAYGAWHSAYSWILRSYPDNYYFNFFLEIFFIWTGACGILLHLIYIYMEEDDPRMLFYDRIRDASSMLLDFADSIFTDISRILPDEDHPDRKTFLRSIEFKRAVRALGAYWLIVAVGQPLSWFGSSEWNLWNGVFVEGMNTPTRVFAISGLLFFLTEYVLDMLKIFIFGKIASYRIKSTNATLYFLIWILDERVWVLEQEKRLEIVLIYLFIHLVSFLDSCYNVFVYPLFLSDQESDIIRSKSARVLCFLTFIITMCAFYLAWSTPALTVHSIILITLIVYLIVKMSMQISAVLVFYPSRWFFHSDNAKRNRRILDLMFYTNYFCKQLIRMLCVMWMFVFHAVKWYRMVQVFRFFCEQIPEALKVYREHTRPWTCIRSLPRANKEQLALKNDVCLMCHENMEEARVTPCDHYYHHDCLFKWLFVDNKCPLCQTVLYSSQLNNLNF